MGPVFELQYVASSWQRLLFSYRVIGDHQFLPLGVLLRGENGHQLGGGGVAVLLRQRRDQGLLGGECPGGRGGRGETVTTESGDTSCNNAWE